MKLFKVALGVAVIACSAPQVLAQVVGNTSVTCSEAAVAGGKKELTCTFAPIKLIVPNTLTLPTSANGATFDLTSGSSGAYVCAPSASAVAGGASAVSNIAANCTGTLPGDYTWAAGSGAPAMVFGDAKASSTTATLTIPATSASAALNLTVCPTAGATTGCQTFSTTIANSTYVGAPTGCAITGLTSTQIRSGASVNLGVTGCSGLQTGATYNWLYNAASVGTATTLSHIPFPAGSSATSGTYVLRVCNPSSPTAACRDFPSANGTTVTLFTDNGNPLAACAAGSSIIGTIDLSKETFFQLGVAMGDNGAASGVLRVIVPNPTPVGDAAAYVNWNSSIGNPTGKNVLVSKDAACVTNGPTSQSLANGSFDAGGTNLRYTSTSLTLPYLNPGTWYIAISSPGCVDKCNFNFEFKR
jgi:hypothetical protein